MNIITRPGRLVLGLMAPRPKALGPEGGGRRADLPSAIFTVISPWIGNREKPVVGPAPELGDARGRLRGLHRDGVPAPAAHAVTTPDAA